MMVSANFPTGGVEFDLLCLLVRPKPDLVRAQRLLHDGIDFPELLRQADDHGVGVQLVDRLGDMSWATIPEAPRSSLENFQRLHCARALSVSAELCRIAAAFSKGGLRMATFKGPALAAALYGDVSRRHYNDIDVLVPEDQVDDAERLLGRLGYLGTQGNRTFRRAFLAYLRQYQFIHPAGTMIDLHWDFTGSHVPFPLTPAEVWRDLDHVSIGGQEIPTISGQNLALLLAGHGTKEAWRSLGWVCDFAMLLDRHPDLDWLQVHRRAKARGCGDAVLLACAMARELLEAPVPRALLGLVDGSYRCRVLTARLTRDLREGRPEIDGARNFSDFHLWDSRFGKLKGAMRLVLTRTTGDYEAMKLPQTLWPIYYATRPFRLAAKALAALR